MFESGEMYLETILVLSQENQVVRSVDIANEMGFSKPSVSRAVNKLKQDGYIDIDSFGYITLKNMGLEIAKRIYDRHTLLTKALCMLGVDEKIASRDACKIEHDISEETIMAIKKHIEQKTNKE